MKFLKLFILLFVLFFSLLNFRVILANVDFWANRNIYSKLAEENFNLRYPSSLLPTEEKRPVINPAEAAHLEIPSIGVSAPIVFEESNSVSVVYNRLRDGVVHFSDSPLPGERGSSLILGHSSAYPWYTGKYGSVFALLGKLNEGDQIIITQNDVVLVYRVGESLVFSPFVNDERLASFERSQDSSLILISCWPVGTNYKRIAVRADLFN